MSPHTPQQSSPIRGSTTNSPKDFLTPERVRILIKYCDSDQVNSPILAAYSCLFESKNNQNNEEKEKSLLRKTLSFIRAIPEDIHRFVQFFTELPLLTLSFAALQASTRWKNTSRIVSNFLWGVSAFSDMLFLLVRAVVSPGKSFEEARKKSVFLAALSLLVTLVAWTAIAGPLSMPISLFAALPVVSVVMAPIGSALGTAAGFISPYIPKIFPQSNVAARIICSAALGAALAIKNTFQRLFPSKKPTQSPTATDSSPDSHTNVTVYNNSRLFGDSMYANVTTFVHNDNHNDEKNKTQQTIDLISPIKRTNSVVSSEDGSVFSRLSVIEALCASGGKDGDSDEDWDEGLDEGLDEDCGEDRNKFLVRNLFPN